jgi:hypothetical protein
MSARQMAGQLGITYRAAWLLEQKLRRAMIDLAADNYLGRLSDNYDGRYDCPLGPDIRRGGAPTGDRPQRAAA